MARFTDVDIYGYRSPNWVEIGAIVDVRNEWEYVNTPFKHIVIQGIYKCDYLYTYEVKDSNTIVYNNLNTGNVVIVGVWKNQTKKH